MVVLRVGKARGLGMAGAVLLVLSSCGGKSVATFDEVHGSAGGAPGSSGARSSASGSSTGGTGTVGPGPARAGSGSTLGGAPAAAGNPSTTAGSGSGGAGGAHAGGGASAGETSTDGGAGDDGAAIDAACASVCSKFRSTPHLSCEGLGSLGPSCQADCTDTFGVQKGDCTELGLKMTTCLTQTTPFPDFADCWIQFYDVSQQCYQEVGAYRDCVASTGAVLPPTLCAQVSHSSAGDPGSGAKASCQEDRKCLNGLIYAIECEDTGDNLSKCTCKRHEQPIGDFAWNETSAQACKDALATCRMMAEP